MDNKSNTITIYKMEAVDQIDYASGKFVEEKMLIGFFNSLAACADVENDYKSLPGFSRPSCNFNIIPYSLSSSKGGKIERVFFVQEWIFDEQTGEETITEIGVFLTSKEAEEEKARYLTMKKGYSTDQAKFNDSIYIDEYEINERHWQEGFTRE